MSRKKRKKSTRLDNSVDYIVDARRLSGRFPSLKKFERRKKLKPHEKGQITRAANIVRIMAQPVGEREERYQQYRFPADRIKSQKWYQEAVNHLIDFDPYLKKWKRRKRFQPWEKSIISRKYNGLPYTDKLFPVTKEQVKALPPEAVRGEFGPKAIKLRNTAIDATTDVDEQSGVLIVTSAGRKWFHIATGPDPDKLAEAAQAAFDNGAKQVHFWTTHGRVGTAAGDMDEFIYQLNNQYMQYLQETIEKGFDDEWLLGIANLYA